MEQKFLHLSDLLRLSACVPEILRLRAKRGPGASRCLATTIKKQRNPGFVVFRPVSLTTDHLRAIMARLSFGLTGSDRSKRI